MQQIQATIEALAKELQQVQTIKLPEWAIFIKTGSHRERVPMRQDWWYIRAASILKTIALKGPIGTAKLRIKYGGRKNRGVKPDKFQKAGGKIIRSILQQLEAANLVKQTEKGVHKGRVATGLGYTFINRATKTAVSQATPVKAAEAAPKPVPEAPKELPKEEKGVEA